MSESIIRLSNVTELKIGENFSVKVAPLPLGKLIELDPKLKKLAKLEKEQDLTKQAEFFTDFMLDILKDLNPTINEAAIKGNLTIEACVKIMQLAMGGNENVGLI